MSVAVPYQPSIRPEASRRGTRRVRNLRLGGLAAGRRALEDGLQLLEIVRMNRGHPAAAQRFFQREARVLQASLVEEIAPFVGRHGPDQRRNGVHDASHLPLGLPSPLLGLPQVGIEVRVVQRDRGLRGQHLEDRGSRRGKRVGGEIVFQIQHATQRGPVLGAVARLDDLQGQTED